MAFYQNLKYYSNDDPNYSNKQDWIASRLLTLRHDLHESITKDRKPNSLIIGSWNLRAFDGGRSRLDESFHYIAEIIDHFDICALQEISTDLGPLQRLLRLMGPKWDYFVSDVSTHEGGNNERIAFVYNTNRVTFRNLIGEIVLGNKDLIKGNQIARTPFFASFQAGWFRFSLCSAHIKFADDLNIRAQEIKAIANALVKRAKNEDQVHIFLGDMNIESYDDVVMKAMSEAGLNVPNFGGTNMKGDKWFDQMAFTVKGKVKRKTDLLRKGKFDWRQSVYNTEDGGDLLPLTGDNIDNGLSRFNQEESFAHYFSVVKEIQDKKVEIGKKVDKDIVDRKVVAADADKEKKKRLRSYYKSWTTFEMSDHLPIWVELEVDYSDDYLRKYLK
ncbi:MAG: endonuclease/exonuclease/phosphatase family metal-dependent hydrolase [Bacteroidia bacterium]|jgi:endonuclease/exonuclease/phosphatase family metal-dependent hydrolase